MSEPAGTRPAGRGWLIVALISLAVNLFLIGGIAGTLSVIRAEVGSGGGPLEQAAGQLHLEAAQEAAFRNLQTTMHQRGHDMRHADQQIWAALASPATGNDKIGGLLDQGLQNKATYEKAAAAAFGQFLTSLTPAQRTEFITRLKALHRSHGPLHLFRRLFR